MDFFSDSVNRFLSTILLIEIIIYFYFRKQYKLFSLVILYYAIGIVGSILYYNLSDTLTSYKIEFNKLFYCEFLLIILAIPFLIINTNKNLKWEDNILLSDLKILTKILFYISLLPFIYKLYQAIFYTNASTLVSAYEGESQISTPYIVSLCIRILRFFQYIIGTLFFYFISKGKLYNKYAYMALLSFITLILIGYVGGGRGTMINQLNFIVINYFIYRNRIEERIRKRLNKILTIGISIFVIGVMSITIARFNNSYQSNDNSVKPIITWASLYLGQGPLEFSKQMYESTVRTKGDNSFSLVKSILGMKTFKDNDERREYWENKQLIQNFIFYTLIGDIYSDLGWEYTIYFCLCMVLFITFYIKSGNTKMTFPKIVIISLYFEWLTMGIMTNCFKVYYLQFYILTTILLLLLLSYRYKLLNKNQNE